MKDRGTNRTSVVFQRELKSQMQRQIFRPSELRGLAAAISLESEGGIENHSLHRALVLFRPRLTLQTPHLGHHRRKTFLEKTP